MDVDSISTLRATNICTKQAMVKTDQRKKEHERIQRCFCSGPFGAWPGSSPPGQAARDDWHQKRVCLLRCSPKLASWQCERSSCNETQRRRRRRRVEQLGSQNRKYNGYRERCGGKGDERASSLRKSMSWSTSKLLHLELLLGPMPAWLINAGNFCKSC